MGNKDHKPFLQLHLVEHCNLNCKGCAHFAPVAPEQEIDIDDLIMSYKRVLPFFYDCFCRIELLGGEPLLHSRIESVLEISRQYLQHAEIRLITNGIRLLDMPDNFFKICAENDIFICISVYPIKLDYEKIERKLEMYGIRHKRYGDYIRSKDFISYKLDPEGNNDYLENYSKCKYAGHCIQLRNMKLFSCFIPAYIDHLNAFFNVDFKCMDRDYIDLKKEVSNEDITRFINNPIPFCKYCDMQKRYQYEWDNSQKSILEWVSE